MQQCFFIQYLVAVKCFELFYYIFILIAMSLSFIRADFQLRKELLVK